MLIRGLFPLLRNGSFSGGIVESKLNDASVNLFMETPKRKLYGVGVGVSDGKPMYRLTALIKL
jgi:hypothetical protein